MEVTVPRLDAAPRDRSGLARLKPTTPVPSKYPAPTAQRAQLVMVEPVMLVLLA